MNLYGVRGSTLGDRIADSLQPCTRHRVFALKIAVQEFHMMQSQSAASPLAKVVFAVAVCLGYAAVVLAVLFVSHAWPF